jgi:hypothetical protein
MKANQGKDHEIREDHTQIKEQDARDQEWHCEPPLMPIQTRGDERPDLVQGEGHGQKHGRDQRQLKRRQKRRRDLGGDHGAAHRQLRHERRRHIGVDLVREREQDQKGEEDPHDTAHQAIAQFDQMGEKGLLGARVVGLARRGHIRASVTHKRVRPPTGSPILTGLEA